MILEKHRSTDFLMFFNKENKDSFHVCTVMGRRVCHKRKHITTTFDCGEQEEKNLLWFLYMWEKNQKKNKTSFTTFLPFFPSPTFSCGEFVHLVLPTHIYAKGHASTLTLVYTVTLRISGACINIQSILLKI